MRLLPDPLRLALGTLTAVPVPPPTDVGRTTAGRAMLLAPLVGLVPGGAGALAAWAATSAGASGPLSAALAVACLALMTRGLHLDGLADTADGLAASYDRQRALDVMRRGDSGPAGVVTVVLVLLVQVAALAQALDGTGPWAVLVAAMAGRLTLPVACTGGVPAARPDGLGVLVAGTVRPVGTAAVVLGAGAVALLAGTAGAAAVLAAVGAAALLLVRCVRRLGGVTGDVLGACVEAGTTAALVVLALS